MVEILNYRNALPLGSMLLEYRLESVLGSGGFGMTYLGYDTHLEIKVAIKEYLPVELAVRALDGCIVPVSTGTEYNYKWGLDRFLQEARLLAKFSHPNIVTVSRYFEANGTAYMVMNYESGVSLSQLLKRIPEPDEELLMRILLPLLDGLHAVHQAGFLHRDIKPSNIFIRDTGVPVLLDFGAARLAVGGTTRTMTSILTPGYAPLEQYSTDGNQGPWTDIYSMAAVMYRAVIGDNPPDSVTRLKDDTVMSYLIEARNRFTTGFLHGVNRGLEVDEKKRPQSVPEWKAMFTGEAYVAPPPSPVAYAVASTKGESADDPPTQRAAKTLLLERSLTPAARPGMTQLTWMAAGALVLFLAMGGQQVYERLSGNESARALQPPEKPGKLTPREFYVLDRDRSGYLTPDEVKGDAVLEQNFKKIDKNRDGKVSLDEFTDFP
ncbi:MAG: protein kinase [Betaproteobacteria bacterium]|nr:protein kinase [Betaproteobacteria bacterium]